MSAILALLLLVSQTVAIVQGDRVSIISQKKAEAEYHKLSSKRKLSQKEQARLAALVIALGTAPTQSSMFICVCSQAQCETIRGRYSHQCFQRIEVERVRK